MKIPLQIRFKDCERSPAIEAVIQTCADRLESHCKETIGCRVLVEAPNHHHRKGSPVHVRVDVTIPGHELVASSDVPHQPGHADAEAAVRAAFAAAERQVTDVLNSRQSARDHTRVSDVLPTNGVNTRS